MKLAKKEVIQRAQVKIKQLDGLLVNKRAVSPLLGFFKIIEIAVKDRLKERKLAWEM